LTNHEISHEDLEKVPQGKMLCEKGTLAKYFYMSAYAFYCKGNLAGTKTDFENKVLSLVEKANFDPKKVAGLPDEIKFMKEILRVNALLDKAWAQYLASDKSPGFSTDLEIVKCYVIPNLKILVLRSMVDICKYGSDNVKKIQALLKQNTHKIPSELQGKIDWLISNVNEYNGDEGELKKLWSTFISNNDTIASAFTVAEKYCDKIIQVKSWCLMGHVNTCEQGQEYLNKIDAFTKEHNLKFDEELSCRITRLKIKVWDCRYWELVEKAWAMTHAEREDFGPKSALVMHKDLNGPKQVCETKVEYEPLGKIGIKYTVKIFLCQNIDLAKMGDPDYYKKIAKWIDTEVLVKYCSPDYRCKEGFTIYIEGHTDGNPMALHKYKEPFNIPKGTPFTHYIGTKDTLEKVLEKDIMFELRTNMELGLGRAWTIRKQLDFMKVPITIGAYEHPKENKGGEFRRMEVELFMPNLLLDFFENRLKELLEASGIGPRPKQCKG
jgi:hypothetical protein